MTTPADRALLAEQRRLSHEHTAAARAHTRQLVLDSRRCCEQSRLLLARTVQRGSAWGNVRS